jgi:6,7-dimethyl-8-ribityllumazine synthase
MGKVFSGNFNAQNKKFGIVVSRFNEFITSKLLAGAIDSLTRHGASEAGIDTAWVPGAFEIPFAAKKLVDTKKYDCVICLGCVIKGDTPHFDYIAAETSKGIAQIGLAASIPVVFGVLTTDSIEQAIERAGTKAGNKGAEAAQTAVEMISLFSQIK